MSFSIFLSNRQLQVFLDGNSLQEHPVNFGVPRGFIFGPTLFLLYVNDLPYDANYNIAINADNAALYSKSDQASDMWQALELTSEIESEI